MPGAASDQAPESVPIPCDEGNRCDAHSWLCVRRRHLLYRRGRGNDCLAVDYRPRPERQGLMTTFDAARLSRLQEIAGAASQLSWPTVTAFRRCGLSTANAEFAYVFDPPTCLSLLAELKKTREELDEAVRSRD